MFKNRMEQSLQVFKTNRVVNKCLKSFQNFIGKFLRPEFLNISSGGVFVK